MKYEDSIKKILVGLIIIIALSLGITMIVAMFIETTPQTQPVEHKEKAAIEKVDLKSNILPKGLPENLPLEKNARITQNFTATAKDGTFQATRGYETAKTLSENLSVYTKYLQDNGWDVSSTINNANYKKVSGSKGMSNLQVSMSENIGKKVKTVTIFLTELP